MKSLFLVQILLFSVTALASLPSEFTVGSYNLYGLRNSTRLKQDLSLLPSVDIWAFQEVEGSFTDRTESQIRELLPSGKWYIYLQKFNLVDQNKGTWEGQAVASRYPFDSTQVVPLNHTDKKQRAALVTNFKTADGRDFVFANTDHEVGLFSIGFSDRKKQLESLVEYFNNHHVMAVITGDFNTTEGATEIRQTEEILSTANFIRSFSGEKDPFTFEKFFIRKELDHFFSRGVETSPRYRLDNRQGSDHYPVYVHIRL